MRVIETLRQIDGVVTIQNGIAVLPNGEQIDLAAVCDPSADFPPPCTVNEEDMDKLAIQAVHAALHHIQQTVGVNPQDPQQALLFMRWEGYLRTTLERYVREVLLAL